MEKPPASLPTVWNAGRQNLAGAGPVPKTRGKSDVPGMKSSEPLALRRPSRRDEVLAVDKIWGAVVLMVYWC